MKSFIVLLFLSPIIGFAQPFEGTITYSNAYKSKAPQVTDEQLNSMMGTNQEYYIKGSDYKSVFNGSSLKMQLYRGVENKSYTLTAKSDSLYWQDFSKNKDAATKFEFQKDKETIMGIDCDVLIIYTEKSKIYSYYNKKYRVNPELYKGHQCGNWYYIISKTKALPLKTVYEDDQFILTSTAVKITPARLGDDIFAIPDKSKIVAATW